MRALFTVSVLALLQSAAAMAAPCVGFVDVDDGNVAYCTAVTFVRNKGITLGCTDSTHYCPNDYVSRLQMALFLQRMGKGGPNNVLGEYTTTIGGGDHNTAGNVYSTIGGGASNNATGAYSSVAGGQVNAANSSYSTVGGGFGNVANGQQSTIVGGTNNSAGGFQATVAGGSNNAAGGATAFAAGYYANANGDGCFVWGDASTTNTVSCNAPNRFVVRSLGGIFMFAGGSSQATYSGVALAPGGTAWVVASDRKLKENVTPADTDSVLRSVIKLPIATWNLTTQDPSIRHLGPMAQDFRAAFGLGESEVGINTIDADGVALAAIQGLNAKLEERERALRAEVNAKDAQIAALTGRLGKLEQDYARDVADLRVVVELLMARTSAADRVAVR